MLFWESTFAMRQRVNVCVSVCCSIVPFFFAFCRTFFSCFEHLIKHYILEEHPNWHSYPFNGRRVMEEFEESLSSSRQHHHHHHHSYHHRTHHRHRSSHNTQIGLTSPEYSHSRRQNETLVPLDTMKVSNPVRPTADCSSTVTLGPSHSSS